MGLCNTAFALRLFVVDFKHVTLFITCFSLVFCSICSKAVDFFCCGFISLLWCSASWGFGVAWVMEVAGKIALNDQLMMSWTC